MAVNGSFTDLGRLRSPFAAGLLGVLAFLGIGPLLALIVALVGRREDASVRGIVIGICLILALGAPAYFIASFGPGMSLADGLMISGADHSHWSLLLYAGSILALVGAIIVGFSRPRAVAAPAS